MFGEILQELRKDRGLTQAELARLLSISPLTISSYECGRSTPDDATKVKLAKIFGVSLDYFLGLIREPLPYERSERVVRFPTGFTADDIQKVEDYIRFLQLQKEQCAHGAKK